MAFGRNLPRISYYEKLQDSRWLKLREEIIAERKGVCQVCGGTKKLEVHHGYYRPGGDPWDYEKSTLWCLCRSCHETTQRKMTSMHRTIGGTHPNQLDELGKRLGAAAFEIDWGVPQIELEEILREEREAIASLYRGYRLDVMFSREYAPTRVDKFEEKAEERFPGIEINTTETTGTRDGVSTAYGPDPVIRTSIQQWADKWIR